ncbi:Axonemal Inner Arm I1 Intermediate Chain Dynein [Phytophthora cinnamomi]|uniref:Axonemal Inner Arm I1 Intermediate Chain Dynein n=1 Tax=Phytophthora cinnamomi TaxID=4785 RepID=UPI003559ABF7|nr:Axonemal Inner Arm I1 Intermediate Chain Dynein [Phytophthora cinnamomi]
MASPSSAKIPVGSSTKQIRASKRDVGGRSRVIGASSVSNSSRRVNGSVANVNGGASGHGSGHSTRVYLDGVDVTPQSLLVSRIKPSTPSGGYDPKGKGKGGKGSRSKAVHGVGASVAGASMAGASMLFSHASSSSADNDSDSESSSSVVATGARGARKELRPSAGDHSVSSSATPTSNQEEDENSRFVAASNGPADPEDHEDGKDDGVDPLLANSGGAVDRAAPLLVSGKSTSVSTGLASARSRRVPVTVTLAETATEMLLEIRSVCVAQDAPYHAAVTARNKRYQAVCAQKKGSDKFVEGRAQTLQLAQKAKEVMTAPPATRDVACVATDWDIYDCGKMEDEINNETDEVGVSESVPSAEVQTQTQTTGTSSEGQPKDPSDATSAAGAASSGAEGTGAGGVGDVQLKQQVEEIVGATLASPGCVLDVDGDIVEDLRYLHTYIGHTGPVYQLLVSPFCSDLFLSCSGDWSLKLWHQADPRGDAALTFHSVDLAQAVLGASWSPSDAAVFAAVAEDGRIELWDLAQSTLDPIVRHFPKKYIAVVAPVAPPTESDGLDATGSSREMTPKGEGDSDRLDDDTYRDPNAASSSLPAAPTMVEVPLECTTVAFAPKAPVLVVGDSTGDVTVYRVPVQVSGTATTFADSASDPASCVEEQAARLLRAIHPNKQE